MCHRLAHWRLLVTSWVLWWAFCLCQFLSVYFLFHEFVAITSQFNDKRILWEVTTLVSPSYSSSSGWVGGASMTVRKGGMVQ